MGKVLYHTPRPWQVTSQDWGTDGDEILIGGMAGCAVAACYPFGDDSHGDKIQKANAILIAAAPDLLAALRRAVMPLECLVANVGTQDAKDRLAEALAAIAMAEGR